jgi:hypothetical protein
VTGSYKQQIFHVIIVTIMEHRTMLEQSVLDSSCSYTLRKTNNGTLLWVSTTYESQREQKMLRCKQQNAGGGIVVDCYGAVLVDGWLEFPR